MTTTDKMVALLEAVRKLLADGEAGDEDGEVIVGAYVFGRLEEAYAAVAEAAGMG